LYYSALSEGELEVISEKKRELGEGASRVDQGDAGTYLETRSALIELPMSSGYSLLGRRSVCLRSNR
jgi:hypothetical protein